VTNELRGEMKRHIKKVYTVGKVALL